MLVKEISPLEGSVKLFEIIVLCLVMQTTGCLIYLPSSGFFLKVILK